jgi:hypothetical protein
MPIHHPPQSSNLLDVLEKILDKGVVIAGDIKISLADVDLLTIKIRLLVASVDKAREIGMDWWEKDPYYSSKGIIAEKEHAHLIERINRLEQVIEKNTLPLPMENEAIAIPNEESSSSSSFQMEESSSHHQHHHKPKKKEK